AIWAGLVRALIVVDAWVYPPAKPARHSPKRPSNPVKTPPRLRVTSAALPSLLIRPQAPTPCAQNVRSGDCCGAPNSWLIAWLGRSPSREAEVLSPRMVLQQRPDLAEVIGADVVDPEDGVGIAHADDGRRMQDRLVRRPDLQLDGAGILEFLRERDLVPGETRFAHVDGRNQRPIALPAAQQSGRGFQRQCALAGFLEQELGDAAHAVAAGARFRSVVIVDADIAIGAGRARRMERHQLVVWRAVGLRGGARLGRADCSRLRAHVAHHDLIAETVHLDEGMVGERAHGGPLLPLYMGKSTGRGKLKCLAALAAHQAIITAERPISLTVSAPAAISIRRTSARADVRF